MKRRIAELITTVIALILIILLPFFISFNGNAFYEDSVLLGIYIFSKCLYGVCLIAVTVWLMFARTEYGSGAAIFGITLGFQLIPLFVRLCLSYAGGVEIIWSVIVLCVSFLIYALLIIALLWTNKKRVQSEQKYAGNSIPVYDEHDQYDENNHFTGIHH